MKKIIINFFICLFITNLTFGQEFKSIKGTVFHKHTTEPISHASVTIKGRPVGTATNEKGQFELHFSNDLIRDTFYITFLGNKSYSSIVKNVLEDSIRVFYLDTLSIPLQPVFILSKGETADQIVNKAIRNIKKNYPSRNYYMNAFYRELSMRDDRYARLVEAAVSIQDYGYDTDLSTTRVKINEIRKSDDFLVYDKTTQVIKRVFGNENLLLKTYNYDFIRAFQNCSHSNFLCKENKERFEFNITDYTQNEKGLVYIIKVRDFSLDNRIKKKSASLEGLLYVQASDYAIIKLDYGIISSEEHSNPYFFQGKYLIHSSTTYKFFNGKYYPELIRVIKPVPSDFSVNSTDSVSGKQYTITTLMINNILTKRRDFKRISNSEREQPKVDLYEKSFPYNSEFWQRYNILLLDPNLKSVIHDLEEEIPLEVQFKQNGK
jgi:hypothetical protein